MLERLEDATTAPVRLQIRPDAPIYPASMIKLAIAVALAVFCQTHERACSEEVTVAGSNMTANDAPSPFVSGYRAQLGALAHAMLASSDNVATNVLIDVLGREAITDACRRLGFAATSVRCKLSGALPLIEDRAATGANAFPAADAAAALRLIAREHARKGSSTFVLEALAAQIWNDKLTRGLDPGDTFVHKTGDTDDVSHDGGILTLPAGRRFVLVVYTPLASNAQTNARFARFMRSLRPYLG